jgi:hypothetical protein
MTKDQIRARSVLPKTAVNFHKMKKGLYLNSVKNSPFEDVGMAKSLNILQAYGEIFPMLSAIKS